MNDEVDKYIEKTSSYELSPTMPHRTQYMAANIGKGIIAKKAPNFPEKIGFPNLKLVITHKIELMTL